MSDTRTVRERRRFFLPRQTHSARGISILAALIAALGLAWFFGPQHAYNPPVGGAEIFFVQLLVSFALYASIQQWTLPRMSAHELAATADLIISLAPLGVAIGFEIYWLGADPGVLSWRHHLVAVLWVLYPLVDFFSTGVTNQLLRERQVGVSPT